MNKVFLKKLRLENFKCYQKTTINFQSLTIVVGENNAGKSCLIESLRLVSKAAQIADRKNYIEAPKEFDLPAITRGFKIDTSKLKIDLKTIVYFYDDTKYAKITAYFETNRRIEIYLSPRIAFAVLYDGKNIVKTSKQAKQTMFNRISILPQIGPIRDNEKILSEETVKDDKDTYLSSLHFRNEMYLWKDVFFDSFKSISEATWSGLKVNDLFYTPGESDYLNLLVQDNNFPAEIGKMGNGLQMWLQIMWFLARSKDSEVIILDEPDVYMHSDMQRKILDLVKSMYPQVIIATHSLEIISRVEPSNILEINKKDKAMHYATDMESAQHIIDDIGGVQNLTLINLGRRRKCLFVEGKDVKILNKFNECLFSCQLNIPIIQYGGFQNIPRIYGASKLFFDETKDQIKCYAIADKDYRDDRIISKIITEAHNEHLNLHILTRKEIENYLIIPEILWQFIPDEFNVTYEKFLTILDALLEQQRDDVFDCYSTQYRIDCKTIANEQWDIATCNQNARLYLANHWTTIDNKISLVSGKSFLSRIFAYFKNEYNVQISINSIFDKMEEKYVPKEIAELLNLLQ